MSRSLSTKTFFRNLSLIYFGQMIMLVAFAAVGFFVIESGSMGEPDNKMAVLMQKVIIVAVPISMTAAYFVFKFVVKQVPVQSALPLKMNKYFVAIIIRSAFLEVPGLLVVVAAITTAQTLLLIIIPLIILVFALLRPTPAAAIQDLELNQEERTLLEDPDAIIAESMS